MANRWTIGLSCVETPPERSLLRARRYRDLLDALRAGRPVLAGLPRRALTAAGNPFAHSGRRIARRSHGADRVTATLIAAVRGDSNADGRGQRRANHGR